ncbi:MAG: rhomboid family intramembrane serine protease [Runella zeae]
MGSIFDDVRGEFSKTNNAVIKLILLNVLVFVVVMILYVVFMFSQHQFYFGLIMEQLSLPANFQTFIYRPWTLFTNFFIHQGPFHIFFNMLSLYWFGQIIEEYLGSRRLVGMFILGGLGGGVLFLALYNSLPYFQPVLSSTTLVGASGAVFAIIVGAATLLPDHTFFVFLIGAVRLKYIAALCIIISMAQLVGPNAGGNLAHLAGALVGFGFIKSLKNGWDWGTPIYVVGDFFQKIFSRKSNLQVPQRARATTTSSNRRFTTSSENASIVIPNQDEIDAILDKISKSGYESLTREEKQKLYKASQQ